VVSVRTFIPPHFQNRVTALIHRKLKKLIFMKIAENLSLRMYPENKEIYSDGEAPIYVKVTVTGCKLQLKG